MSCDDDDYADPRNLVHANFQPSNDVEALSVIDSRISGLLAEALAMASYFDRYRSANSIVLALTAHDLERSALQDS
ncbi:MAG: hypothetical protein LCH39_01255 [Proteobacteria bacterium]|nr:hypothetical protein [Pseudomonadota bacterium]